MGIGFGYGRELTKLDNIIKQLPTCLISYLDDWAMNRAQLTYARADSNSQKLGN